MRRKTGNFAGFRYLGNTNKKEVHDLDNEKPNCQIDEIIKNGHAIAFQSLNEAHDAGFDNCFWCLGWSKR